MRDFARRLNRRRRLLQAVLAGLLPGARGAVAAAPAARLRRVMLGDSAVTLAAEGPDGARVAFVNVHENEGTSVQAARAVLAAHGAMARMVLLQSRRTRNVVFWIGARPFAFDPNRIFTGAGIARTLRLHGADTPAARSAVTGLRAAIVDALQLPRTAMVVALHNNGVGRYDIGSYGAGGGLAAHAAAVEWPAGSDPGDFYLVTQRRAYEVLRDSGFGVVLQHPDAAAADDDGSMSLLFGAGRSPLYVNVEARHGHLQQQQRMLQLLLDRMDALVG